MSSLSVWHYKLLINSCKGALCSASSLDQEFESLLRHAVGEGPWNGVDASDICKMINNDVRSGSTTSSFLPSS